MRILADQDVYASTVAFLKGLGHDVLAAAEVDLVQAADTEVLRFAREERRVLVTRDRDFGSIVFVQGGGPGVIYLRVLPSTQQEVHAEIERVLTLYSEQDALESFIVVEPGRHRIRRLGPGRSG